MLKVDSGVLTVWVSAALEAAGVPEKDAGTVARALVQTNLWGIDSHGVSRLPHYLNRISKGSVKARPEMRWERTAAATGRIDADQALGIVACDLATEKAIELAREAGTAVIGVGNSSHCGAMSLYVRRLAAAGLAGLGFTHSDSFVVPHGGKQRFFGTNPIAIAVPTQDPQRPVCVDAATSIVAWNRIMMARITGETVPVGWGVGADGEDATDPEQIVAVKPMSGHKGYALAFLIDMLSGPLNGMPYGPHVPRMYENLDQPRNLGALIIAIDPDRFGGRDFLAAMATQCAVEVKGQGENVMYPGEPEYNREAERLEQGIPLDEELLGELNGCAERLGIAPLNI